MAVASDDPADDEGDGGGYDVVVVVMRAEKRMAPPADDNADSDSPAEDSDLASDIVVADAAVDYCRCCDAAVVGPGSL